MSECNQHTALIRLYKPDSPMAVYRTGIPLHIGVTFAETVAIRQKIAAGWPELIRVVDSSWYFADVKQLVRDNLGA